MYKESATSEVELRTHFIFDTNILWKLCKSDRAYKKWDRGMKEFGLVPPDGLWGSVPRPFMLLETLGIKAGFPNLAVPPKFFQEPFDSEKLKAYLYEHALAYYRTLPQLTAASLKAELIEQRKKANKLGRNLIDDIFSPVVEREGFESQIHVQLALNFAYAFPISEPLRQRFQHSLEVDIFRSLGEHRNLTQARVIELSWQHWTPILLSGGHMSQAVVARITESVELKKARDLGDTDIVHFATVGVSDQKVLHPVIAFTSDPIQKIRDRIYVFKTVTRLVYEVIAENTKPDLRPFPLLRPVPGRVVLCDQRSGEIVEVIDVATFAEP